MTYSRHVLWTVSLGLALVSLAAQTAMADPVPGPQAAEPEPERSVMKDILGLSGSVRADYFSKDKSFSGKTGYAVGSIWATATPQEVAGIRTYFDARLQGQDLTRGSRVSSDLREAYAQTALGEFDLRVGRQITVWGRADKVNPTDAWSTRDYTLLVPNDEDQRLGVASLQATWNRGPYRVIGLWQPEWRSPVLPIPPLPRGISLQNVAPTHPAGQFGIKLDHSGQGVDWSVSYAHSINRTPDLAIESLGLPGASVGLRYRHVEVIGADAAVPVGQYGLRAEIAYTKTGNRGGNDPLAQNDNLFAVAGVERTFAGELNVNAQYLYRRTFDLLGPDSLAAPAIQVLAQQERLLSNQLATNMHGASLRVNYKAWNETLEIELAAAVWFKNGDTAIRPKVTYAFTDRVKSILGGEIYHGPAQSFFGRLSPTSVAYAELQLGF
jgi:hypothetical protein